MAACFWSESPLGRLVLYRIGDAHSTAPCPAASARSCKAARKDARNRAGRAVADRLPVDAHHRRHPAGGGGDESFARRLRFVDAEAPFFERQPVLPGNVETTARVMPSSICASVGAVKSVPSSVTIQALLDAPSLTKPSRIDEPGLMGAGLDRRLLGKDVGQQRHGLDVDACPAGLRHGDDGDPLLRSAPRRRVESSSGDNQRRPHGRNGKRMAARRNAAGDLEVEEAVGDAVAADDFATTTPR